MAKGPKISDERTTSDPRLVQELKLRAQSLQAEVELQKKIETKLSRMVSEQAKKGAASEEVFRHLVESVRDYAIFFLDTNGRVATWNVGAQRIKGYRAGEVIGRHFSIFYPDEDVRAGKCEYAIEEATREGYFETEGWRVRKDGSRFWANVAIGSVRDDSGDLLGYSKVTRDLTERKKAQEEREARIAAEEANKAKDEFLALLGHELRNPLAPIVTALQLLKLRGDHRTSREQQIIERQVKHLMRLVDDLLDVSRITKGKVTLNTQQVDVRNVLAKAVEIASHLLEQREHQFEVDIPDREVFIDADEARLTQVFANLLLNAAKYTEPGGHIGMSVRQDQSGVIVEVRDDGIGIAPDLLSKVFEAFVQGSDHAHAAAGGLGIGLTLVQTLVRMHGGTVQAQSPGVGKGSTFTVWLRNHISPGQEPQRGAIAAELGRQSGACRTLVVDDNEDAAVLLGELLSDFGYDVRTAYDAPTALEIVQTFVPDVAILDIGLPLIDGYDLASRLRADLGVRTPHLIALSGYAELGARDKSRQAGFVAHLVKPIDPRRLLEMIAEIRGSNGAEGHR